jgi:DnaJ family protein C protein 9
VTEEDVDAFHDSYRGGYEERRDVLEAYGKFEGDMSKVFMWVMCSEEAVDAHRFADIVDEALKNKKVSAYSAYSSWAKAVRNKRAPKDPLRNRAGRKLGASKKGGGKGDGGTGNDDGDLMALIRSRQNSRAAAADDLFVRLEAKYGHDDGGKKKGDKGKDGATKVKGGGVAKKKAK